VVAVAAVVDHSDLAVHAFEPGVPADLEVSTAADDDTTAPGVPSLGDRQPD
jgi:hypothetical protein